MRSIYFVIGATGSGKSLAAVRVAKTLQLRCGCNNVVILNCDVMQFYAGLPIVTNKISSEEMDGIPHCFMSFLSPEGNKIRDPTLAFGGCDREAFSEQGCKSANDAYNIHSFVRDAVSYIESFLSTHSPAAVVVCGGTCYYVQSLLFDNLLTVEDTHVSGCLDTTGGCAEHTELNDGNSLWDQLKDIDPDIAARYHPNDIRRIRRLVDIYKRTNRIPSDVYNSREKPRLRFCPSTCFILWTHIELEKLRPKLNARIDVMVEKGIIEECRKFAQRHKEDVFTLPLGKAIGFKEIVSSFDMSGSEVQLKGEREVSESLDLLKVNTNRYARQQCQWIKNRFLGRLRELFATVNLEENFVAVDASASPSDFLRQVEVAVLFFTKRTCDNVAGLFFPLKKDVSIPSPVRHEWCGVCNVFYTDGRGRISHLHSKRHRGALRHEALVKEQAEKFGRIIPSKRVKRS
ncbi:tRNA isopentenyltransferase, putative [Trypanosoma brucei brucei TREU927]|uniref:tRNA isopentenyltransferase, putative n=1 Tax=Trypanosoma brucei brucei (strain 927/4 GUTat10.1) TaxID=185431 RepID=Q582P5_TRYB2|nr:tRNA isopentenyltransferase, putative [Trypanosoma brucei brucei TREU927]AAX80659.1 tRNA isopentenyltransferase, putative [Trypanosoma brucei]AAZ10523.1 tRNA isopentenyltransferase, putative [Trypanosoma brucei brucei TREU927]